jgi:hypothetical protein
MNGWNRLFVVTAVVWAIAAPFLVMESTNSPLPQTFDRCGSAAYQSYGDSDARIRLDMDKYHEEVERCSTAFSRDFVSIQKVFSAMIGIGDRTLGLVAWGFFLIPLCVLWVAGWGLGRIVRWVGAGFSRSGVE